MILTIDKKDLEIFEKVCALNNFDMNVYTIESNVKIMTVEILYRKRELSAGDAFYFGRYVQGEMDDVIMDRVYEKIKTI